MFGRGSNHHRHAIKAIAGATAGVVACLASSGSAQILYHPVVTVVGDGTSANATSTSLLTTGDTTTIDVFQDNTRNQLAPIASQAYNSSASTISSDLVNTATSTTEATLENNPGLADAAAAGVAYSGTAFVFSSGYAAADGTAKVNTTAGINRVVGYMTVTANSVGSPVIGASQTATAAYNTGNIRGAVGDDTATNFWTAGTGSPTTSAGFQYFNTTPSTQLFSTFTNTRQIQIRNGQLYGTSETGTNIGITEIGTGTPKMGGQANTLLFDTAGPIGTGTGSSTNAANPYSFFLLDDPNNPSTAPGTSYNTAYIADAGAQTDSTYGGGIQKWTYSPANAGNGDNGWTEAFTITEGDGGVGYTSLAGQLVKEANPANDQVVLWTVSNLTSQNNLEEFIDPLESTDPNSANASLINLATAPKNDAFRGVALAPGGGSLPPPPPPNHSTLFLSPTQTSSAVSVTDSKDAVVSVGGQHNLSAPGQTPQYELAVFQGGSATASVVLGASSSIPTDTTTYVVQSAAAPNSARASQPGNNDPITAGGTDTASFGFNPSDTQVQPGSTISGTATFANQNNSADGVITVTTPAVTVIEGRLLDASASLGSTDTGANVGKILVNKTGTAAVQLASHNSDTFEGDFSSASLTSLTLKANATSTAFTQTDPLTGANVANISATAPAFDQVFGGPNQGQTGAFDVNGNAVDGAVTLSVQPLVSGVYGDDRTITLTAANTNTTTRTYAANYTEFDNTNTTGAEDKIIGEGLPGESNSDDNARAYAQWQGYQAASVTGSLVGNTLMLTNAATNDNVYAGTLSATQINSGLRAAAWVTSAAANQDGWSSGLTPSTDGSGTVVLGSQSAGDTNNYAVSTTLSYNSSAALAGTYSGGTYTVGLENEQDIQGASTNDLPAANVALASEIGTGTGTGTYTLGGGTFTALPLTLLSGSFTQTGGAATFGQLNVTGSVTLVAGSTSASGLSTSGSGTVDLTTQNLAINYTGSSPETSIRAQLLSGAAGGPGIISSFAKTHSGYAVGYLDSSVDGGTSLPANELLLKVALIGDANLDGTVNLTDLLALLNTYGQTGKDWAAGDFNYDGSVNLTDLLALLNNYGESANVSQFSGSQVVPEPMSLGFITLGGLTLLGRRRRRA